MSQDAYRTSTVALFDAVRLYSKLARRNGDFALAQSAHRLTLSLNARLAQFEREARRLEHEQLTMVARRAGRRHDDGDAA